MRNTISQKFSRLTSLVTVAAGLLIGGCASLPEVRYLNQSLVVPAAPTVINAKGELSAGTSTALLVSGSRNSPIDVAAMAAKEESATGTPLIAGNEVTLLHDGPRTMAAMMDAINAATDHINLETYIFDQDELGMRFADLLVERQRAGVQVNIIYDSIGTLGTPQEFFDKMRDAGIRLLAFNPVNPLKLTKPWAPNHRDHRKILVVDGKIGFTGGVNISDDYASSSLFRSRSKNKSAVGWRDTHIRIEGPAVAALQQVFLDHWISQKAPAIGASNFFPPLQNVGNKLVRVLASAPGSNHDIYKAYILAIQEAQSAVHITSAYFVPDVEILKALTDAAKRGVDVKIILPGVTDNALVFHAARSFYSEMLAAGIRLYHLQIAVLHAKTAVIDKVWATVGSTNIDTRSFLHNSEINVVIFGDEFANAMESAFNEDLRFSVEVTAEEWEQRPSGDRFKEWMARRLEHWL